MNNSQTVRFNDSRDWFFKHRFGLFIHWGPYALNGWHEQEIWRFPVTREDYVKRSRDFNPVRFDAHAWVDAARAAGMDYLVFTTKHVDGFCNWDSAHTDYKITNTPFGRDVLKELSVACQERGMPLCLYYSIPDMHHPAYPHQGRPYEFESPLPGDKADFPAYFDYVREQMRELLTQYGPIYGWWWDGNVMEHKDESLHDLVRELQPQAVINNRGFGKGDFRTPERDWDNSVNQMVAFKEPTEACQSIGLISWGWKEDEDYYSDWHIQHSMAKVMGKGGNYLLNVGPRADGTFSEISLALLNRMGAWYNLVKEAFAEVEPVADMTDNAHVLLTRWEDSLYVILHKVPVTNAVRLRPINQLPKRATLLNTGQAVDCLVNRIPGYGPKVDAAPFLRLRNLPVNSLAGELMVIKLEFDSGMIDNFSRNHQGSSTEREFSADAY